MCSHISSSATSAFSSSVAATARALSTRRPTPPTPRSLPTYAIVHTKIFGDKMEVLDERDVPAATAKFQLIPPGSVVEAAWEKAAGLPPPEPIAPDAANEEEPEEK